LDHEIIELQKTVISGNRSGPHLLITGGVHGDEFEPMAAIRRLMNAVHPSGFCGTLTLVPVVNEGAYVRGERTADDELDLARVCPGRADGSITERTAHALCGLIESADFYIDLHTGGTTLCVFPLTGYILHGDARVLEAQRTMARAFNLPVIWGTPYLPGRSLSVAHDAGIPAIYAEYHGGGRCEPAGVEAYVDGCLNVMAELKMLDRALPPCVIEHVVEDRRPNAGFMQIQNPSPMAGFFEPAVQLGQPVRRGDLLGTICDVLGSKVESVNCQADGIVLVLKIFSRVLRGESLGVILEVKPH
jgi:predicted deacylase